VNGQDTTIHELTDPREIEQCREQMASLRRNLDWLEAHAQAVYSQHRGRFIAIAGQELFVADSPTEALSLAQATHPEDGGAYARFIHKERLPRLYANRWRVA
jgi:hypothetical protein